MATKLQEIRKTRGFTQKELAEKTGMNLITLRRYENGDRNINLAAALTVWKLSQVLECGIEELLDE